MQIVKRQIMIVIQTWAAIETSIFITVQDVACSAMVAHQQPLRMRTDIYKWTSVYCIEVLSANPRPAIITILLENWNEALVFTMYTCLAEDTLSSLLPVDNSQQEYCISRDGDILLAGDSWKPNACTSCICNNGTIQCFSQRCLAAKCKVPVLRKGQCCPQCLGKSLLAWCKLLILWCIPDM